MIWIALFLQTIFQYKFYCTSCCCVVLVTSLSMYPTQILLFRFYSLVIKLTLDRGDSWDSSSSVECMLTNQLPIKKGKKDDRNFRVLLDFIKVCLCEVYKDQNGWLLEIRGDQSGLIWSMSPFLWTASSAPCWQLFCLMGLAPYV